MELHKSLLTDGVLEGTDGHPQIVQYLSATPWSSSLSPILFSDDAPHHLNFSATSNFSRLILS